MCGSVVNLSRMLDSPNGCDIGRALTKYFSPISRSNQLQRCSFHKCPYIKHILLIIFGF